LLKTLDYGGKAAAARRAIIACGIICGHLLCGRLRRGHDEAACITMRNLKSMTGDVVARCEQEFKL
jgi:hypothetical protein